MGRLAKVIIGISAGLALIAVAAAVLPGFFGVRPSPCLARLHAISNAERTFHSKTDRYTATFAELDGVVLEPNSPYTFALDTSHPNCPDCQFVATCRSSLPNRDLWSIASVERSVRGQTVPAFVPFHDLNGE